MNRLFSRIVIAAIAVLLGLVGFSPSSHPARAAGQALFPVGVAYDPAGGHFLVSSLSQGTITAVKDNGTTQPFVEDAALVSTVAVKVDPQRQRLLVTNASWGLNNNHAEADSVGKIAGLGIYNLLTGKQIAYVDLRALRPDSPHFASDVALDSVGKAYVTDSLSPVIYQVDPNGKASILVEDKRLTSKGRSPISLVYHPDGYLIIGIPDSGALFKISLANPKEFNQIAGIPKFLGVNSMVLMPDGKLAIAQSLGTNSAVFLLGTANSWKTATIKGAFSGGEKPGMVLTLRGADLYALYSPVNILTASNAPSSPEKVDIQRVNFLSGCCS
jgi:DNA-binding beta-propeller fold protein YncE